MNGEDNMIKNLGISKKDGIKRKTERDQKDGIMANITQNRQNLTTLFNVKDTQKEVEILRAENEKVQGYIDRKHIVLIKKQFELEVRDALGDQEEKMAEYNQAIQDAVRIRKKSKDKKSPTTLF